jgi:hypothetical protein
VVEEVAELELLVVAHVGPGMPRFVEIGFKKRLERPTFPDETHFEPKERRSLLDFAARGNGPDQAGDDDAPDAAGHDGYHTMEDDFPYFGGHAAFVVIVVVVFDGKRVSVESGEVVGEENEATHGSFAFADDDVEAQQGYEPAEKAEEKWAVIGCDPCRDCKEGTQAGTGESLKPGRVGCSDGLTISLVVPHNRVFAELLYIP